ncbi:MAG TPA: acyl-homoserine-lactone synthase [Caulobacteraceae bacterium]|jgi:acyl-homoserine lactone synthase
MLQVISGSGRAAAAPLLAQMHRDRKTVFVDRLGWRVPVVGDQEIDQFDGGDAVYLVATDEAGAHAGSLRLLPTEGPHLLADVFPHLCERGVPRGPDIWEITRLFTTPEHPDPRSVRRQLVLGMVEFAVLHGIHRYTCLTHVPYLSSVLAVGWDCEPLGLPQDDGGVLLGAVVIDVTPETLLMMRARRGVTGSVLLRPETLDAA